MSLKTVLLTLESEAIAKFEQLIALTLPAALKLEASGGLPGLKTSVETFLRRYAQDAVEDFKATAEPMLLKATDQVRAA